jgi:hypothetical protein
VARLRCRLVRHRNGSERRWRRGAGNVRASPELRISE